MKRSTKLDERGELPRCAACGKVTGEGAPVVVRVPEEGIVAFCDADCREVYFTRMDLARDEGDAGDLAA
jgi:hypothetical protein